MDLNILRQFIICDAQYLGPRSAVILNFHGLQNIVLPTSGRHPSSYSENMCENLRFPLILMFSISVPALVQHNPMRALLNRKSAQRDRKVAPNKRMGTQYNREGGQCNSKRAQYNRRASPYNRKSAWWNRMVT